MVNIRIDPVSKVDLTHLSIQKEGDEYTIGDPQTAKFIRVPEPAVYVIRLADGSRTVEEIKEKISRDNGVEVDVLDFVTSLHSLKLVHSVDGIVLAQPGGNNTQNPLAVKAAKAIFHPVTKWAYLLIACTVVFLLIWKPTLIPVSADLFVLPTIGANTLLVSVIACLMICIHELGHLLAAYSVGVQAKIRLNIRYIFITAETNMTGLWAHPKEKRYLPYLAGMAWDFSLFFAALLIQMNTPEHSFFFQMARLAALLLFLGILSQFMFFLRTDWYYVIGNWTNSADLAQSGKLFLKRMCRPKNQSILALWQQIPRMEKAAAKWFAFFYVTGIGILTFMFLFYTIPAMYRSISMAVMQVTAYTIQMVAFWDGAIVLALIIVRLALYLIGAKTAYRDRRNKRAGSLLKDGA